MENLEKWPTCGKFRAVLIGGYKADEEEVKEAAWTICKYLFDLSERRKLEYFEKVTSIVDTSPSLSDTPDKLVEEIQQWLTAEKSCAQAISMCIFAHSHGTKILNKALSQESLESFYSKNKNKTGDKPMEDCIKQIRQSLAIFAIGGIANVPCKMAKVALNLRFHDDVKSVFGKRCYGRDVVDKSDEVIITQEGKLEVPHGFWDWRTLKSFFSDVKALATGTAKHALEDYGNSNPFWECVQGSLDLNSRHLCSCMQDTEMDR